MIRILAPLCLIGILTGCVSQPIEPSQDISKQSAVERTFMTEEEILNTLPGSTVSSIAFSDGKTKVKQVIGKPESGEKNGQIVGDFGGEAYRSTWKVKNGMWCEDWDGGSDCWQIEQAGELLIRLYLNGKPRDQLWTINP